MSQLASGCACHFPPLLPLLLLHWNFYNLATMSSGSDITSGPHNDLVGGDASKGRIPGAEKATSGHFFVSIDPSGVCCLSSHELRTYRHILIDSQATCTNGGQRSICLRLPAATRLQQATWVLVPALTSRPEDVSRSGPPLAARRWILTYSPL